MSKIKYHAWKIFALIIVSCFFSAIGRKVFAEKSFSGISEALLGARVSSNSKWVGRVKVDRSLSFLVLAGHADSQGIGGAGTAGEAVDMKGLQPMDPSISDELFWNLLIMKEIAKLGKERGLNVNAYDPGTRNIVDGNHPDTNWSVGARHARQGGYPIEIHFDSYGKYGFGSGLIPAISTRLNTVDENLARSFGRYPLFFRGGLGAPRRGIRVLEIGKLEGQLEQLLRDTNSRQDIVRKIAIRIVNALELGVTSSS